MPPLSKWKKITNLKKTLSFLLKEDGGPDNGVLDSDEDIDMEL